MKDPSSSLSSPLSVDEQARLSSLKEDLAALVEGCDPSVPAPAFSDEILTRLVCGASSHATLPIRYLARCGLVIPPPEELPDDKLREELWKVIWVMGLLRLFLDHTDHLTDREFYTFLHDEALQDPTAFVPGEETPPHYFIDPLSGGSADDARQMLAYYRDRLDEPMIELYQEWFPGEAVESISRPADRDRFLP